MQLVQIDNWQEYRRDGLQFFATAEKAWQKKSQAFNTEVLYNLICMALEKLIMAFLMKRGDLAENHTMGDLHRALVAHLELPQTLVEELQWLDGFQEICSLDEYTIKAPTAEDIEKMLAIGRELKALLLPDLEEKI